MHINVCLVGHSLIRRFRNDVQRQSNVVFQQNLGIEEIDVQYISKSGWCVEHILANASRIVTEKPQIIILQCGTNDLCSATDPIPVAAKLLDAAVKVKKMAGAKWIFVCQILHRKQGRYCPAALDEYNARVDQANSWLKGNCEQRTGVKFWKHRGMKEPVVQEFGPVVGKDGVHLAPRGQYKLHKSLRGAVLFGLNHSPSV